jgi:hypothetical protein
MLGQEKPSLAELANQNLGATDRDAPGVTSALELRESSLNAINLECFEF